MNVEINEAIAADFGIIYDSVVVGKFSQTYLVATETGKLIVKRMSDYEQSDYEQVFELLRLHHIPHAPHLKCIALPDNHWLAVSQFMPGYKATADWNTAYPLLTRLNNIPAPMLSRRIEKRWLNRLREMDNSVITNGLNILCEHPLPENNLILTHGDFAPQNVLTHQGHTLLIDWEESGCASPGFDAGWVLALNRIGAGFQNVTLPEISHLNWYIGLGLLRLYYRLLHLMPENIPKEPLLHKIETEFLELSLT